MERYSRECYGIDVNKEIIKKCNNKRMQVMSATELNFPDASFDKIYSSHVIEHIPDLNQAFREVFRVLRPGGKFIALFPCEPFRGARALKDAFKLKKGLSYARQLHVHRLSPHKIRQIIRDIPFKKITSRVVFTLLPDYLMTFQK
jgi:ubiquinone/menaquinone biosynthesis C-methylase UbiE